MNSGAVIFLWVCIFTLASFSSAHAEGDASELATKLSNPVSSLISIPFQFNYDQNIGSDENGEKFSINFQPVVPFTLNEEWNVISRTIFPLIAQDETVAGEDTEFGLGDTLQSFFISPKESDPIWGLGPAFLIPSATDELMGGEKWAAGPTGVVLKQVPHNGGNITYGMLGSHLWDYAGEGDRADIDQTYLQPFLSYTTASAWTYGANLEGSYNWEGDEASIPLNLSVSKLTFFNGQPVSLRLGGGYWLDSPDDAGPEGFRFRTAMTFIFPK